MGTFRGGVVRHGGPRIFPWGMMEKYLRLLSLSIEQKANVIMRYLLRSLYESTCRLTFVVARNTFPGMAIGNALIVLLVKKKKKGAERDLKVKPMKIKETIKL